MTDAKQKFGEWSEEAPVTEKVENICTEAGKRAGVHFDVCIPKTFRVKVLDGGTHYLVKVKVGVDKWLHVWICQAFYSNEETEGSVPTVTGVQYPKLRTDPLEPKHF